MPDRTKQFVDDEDIPIALSDEKAKFVKVRELPADVQDMYKNFQEWNPLFGSDVLHYQQQRTTHFSLARKQFPDFEELYTFIGFMFELIKTLAPPKKRLAL